MINKVMILIMMENKILKDKIKVSKSKNNILKILFLLRAGKSYSKNYFVHFSWLIWGLIGIMLFRRILLVIAIRKWLLICFLVKKKMVNIN